MNVHGRHVGAVAKEKKRNAVDASRLELGTALGSIRVAFIIAGFLAIVGGSVRDGGFRRGRDCQEVRSGGRRRRLLAGGTVWDWTGTWRRFNCNTLGMTGLSRRGIQMGGAA